MQIIWREPILGWTKYSRESWGKRTLGHRFRSKVTNYAEEWGKSQKGVNLGHQEAGGFFLVEREEIVFKTKGCL